MKTDEKGCSTCKAGEEHYEHFRIGKKNFVQYDFRTAQGVLFSTFAPSLDVARNRRDDWLKKQ